VEERNASETKINVSIVPVTRRYTPVMFIPAEITGTPAPIIKAADNDPEIPRYSDQKMLFLATGCVRRNSMNSREL